MALDGAFLHHLKNELNEALKDTRVEKVYQPAKEEIVLSMRGRGGAYRLLLSARANSPRVNLTEYAPENPQTPPMLCMLLRKRLCSAKLKSITQPQLERILIFTFDAANELGDRVELSLIAEIMGKYSNVILVDSDGIIIDALKRVDISMSQKRLVLPGLAYEMPPAQDKLCFLDTDDETAAQSILSTEKNMKLNKAVLNSVQGFSPIICRELEHLTGRGEELNVCELSNEQKTRFKFFFARTAQLVKNSSGVPCVIKDIKTGKPVDFSFMDITQYGTAAKVVRFESFSELLDNYYFERDRAERIRQRAQDLLKLLTNLSDRLSRKINTQLAELSKCEDRETLRINGDLIQANAYRIEKGALYAEVENYFEESLPVVKIKLDPALTAAQNAQRYYKEYRKAKTAQQMLKVQIEKAKEELEYIDSVFDALSRADKESELSDIRQELSEQGYIKRGRGKQKKPAPMPFLEFVSESGFKILVGRNNHQNDKLTLKTAKNYDLWFHTKNIPGSHTVVVSDGREIDEQTVIMAAQIAAYHSRARESSNVPVDYTIIKNVSKPAGAKPGMVIYKNNKTVYVTPHLPGGREKM